MHDIDYINWILDDRPISIYATGKKIQPEEIGAGELDTAVIVMEYANKTIATLNLSRISTNYDQRIEIYGADGDLCINNPYANTNMTANSNTPISFPERYATSYQNELIHFLNVIQKTERIKVTQYDCLNCFHIIKACELSISKSAKVNIKYNCGFREYTQTLPIMKSIENVYHQARIKQTVEYVQHMHAKYLEFNIKMNILDIFRELEKIYRCK